MAARRGQKHNNPRSFVLGDGRSKTVATSTERRMVASSTASSRFRSFQLSGEDDTVKVASDLCKWLDKEQDAPDFLVFFSKDAQQNEMCRVWPSQQAELAKRLCRHIGTKHVLGVTSGAGVIGTTQEFDSPKATAVTALAAYLPNTRVRDDR
eukprot:jgi/Bigna1/81108/fgenesh1_pg.77_\